MWFDYELQLQWIRQLQAWGGTRLGDLIWYLNFLDTPPFYIVLIAGLWALAKPRTAFLPSILLLLNGSIIQILKHLCAQPRPFILDPNVALVSLASFEKSNGFPSGAAQTAVLMTGICFLHLPNWRMLLFAVSYSLLLGFSRIYLGVHFISDVLAGYALGLLLLALYSAVRRKHALFAEQLGVKGLLLFSLVAFVPAALYPRVGVERSCWGMFGIVLGHFIAGRWHLQPWHTPRGMMGVQLLITVAGVIVIGLATKQLATPANILLGLWVSCGALLPQRIFARA